MPYQLVVVANRLPVDLTVGADGAQTWTRSPGGLVSAMEPVMQGADGAWVGWSGAPDVEAEPFDAEGMRLVPVPLTADEVADYYEGFANDTLWPLSHDVISTPVYHRHWWDAYRRVNERFARAAAEQAAPGAVVWVHDYQLQLVPALLRELRPDVRIGYFHHIPFPPLELFAQLPWRRQVVEGLLGADLVGFQRVGDAANFLRVARRWTGLPARRGVLTVPGAGDAPSRRVRVGTFPISIDSRAFDALARSPRVRARAAEIRTELGSPDVLLLGVDRLDYTKGIRHRVQAVGELVAEGRLDVPGTAFVQVASPSRENVEAYQQLREEVELAVGRINGEHGRIGHQPIHYLHHSYPPDEMAALYLAADVMLVTSLRDGMNLVAKEYAAANVDDRGVLVLSEFTGAADELTGALLVNPHDIDGLKDAIEAAARMPAREVRQRMRRLRRRVLADDVAHWSRTFLDALAGNAPAPHSEPTLPAALDEALGGLARDVGEGRTLLVALDFDGVLAPLVDVPSTSRATSRSVDALHRLAGAERVRLAVVSGRPLAGLADVVEVPDGTLLVGSHGAEHGAWRAGRLVAAERPELDPARSGLLAAVGAELAAAAQGSTARVEIKPAAVVLHTRRATPQDTARLTDVALELGERDGVTALRGHDVVELSVLEVTKGDAVRRLRAQTGADRVLVAGDDVTDEHAFAVLEPGDVAVKVGSAPSAALHRVADPDALADLLQRLADLLGD